MEGAVAALSSLPPPPPPPPPPAPPPQSRTQGGGGHGGADRVVGGGERGRTGRRTPVRFSPNLPVPKARASAGRSFSPSSSSSPARVRGETEPPAVPDSAVAAAAAAAAAAAPSYSSSRSGAAAALAAAAAVSALAGAPVPAHSAALDGEADGAFGLLPADRAPPSPSFGLGATDSARKCPQCGNAGLTNVDSSLTCTYCGDVVEENSIVSEVTFVEGANGSCSVLGQFLPSLGTGRAYRKGLPPGLSKESREMTIENGRAAISRVASTLGLNSFHVEAAQRLFLLAVQHNFIQGRKTIHVVAACLYIVCRREKTPHMLIDFSDVLQINVYTLGHTFLLFCRILNMQLPIIDPSLYLQRFAAKLELEEKTHLVTETALRLIARMKRDWMQTGRHPSGICGAGLLIAARLHGFRRTHKEIVDVVRICNVTLRKRLAELAQTETANQTAEELTAEDFDVDALPAADPPAFSRAVAKREQEPLSQEDARLAALDREMIAAARKFTEMQYYQEIRELTARSSGRPLPPDPAVCEQPTASAPLSAAAEAKVEPTPAGVSLTAPSAPPARPARPAPSAHAETAAADAGISSQLGADASPAPAAARASGFLRPPPPSPAAAPAPPASGVSRTASYSVAAAAAGAAPASTAAAPDPRPAGATAKGCEESLSDLDDVEMDSYLNTEVEVKVKTELWEELNKDYLEEVEARKRKAHEQAAGKASNRRRKRPAAAESAAAATLDALQKKMKVTSSKINYSALKDLFSWETDTSYAPPHSLLLQPHADSPAAAGAAAAVSASPALLRPADGSSSPAAPHLDPTPATGAHLQPFVHHDDDDDDEGTHGAADADDTSLHTSAREQLGYHHHDDGDDGEDDY